MDSNQKLRLLTLKEAADLGRDPDRSGHRGTADPPPAERPGTGRGRPGDLRRIPRAQPAGRPGPGALPRRAAGTAR